MLLVDLAGGDQTRILGVEPHGPGLSGWLGHENPPPDALARLEQSVVERVSLLPFVGAGNRRAESSGYANGDRDLGERLSLLAHLLAADDRLVIVDLGVRAPTGPDLIELAHTLLTDVAERSTLVTRLCYLALAAAMELPVPDDVIVVADPDRALRTTDVASALRAPVSSIRWDPAVARAVDSGLLTRRLPRTLNRIPLVLPSPVDAERVKTHR